MHKEGVLGCGYHDTLRTLVFTGRPLRIKTSAYIQVSSKLLLVVSSKY